MDVERIADAVREGVGIAATTLRPDVESALRRALEAEPSERGKAVIGQLLRNAELACTDRVPLCQDTGVVWVRLELGAEERLTGDLVASVDEAVRGAYRDRGLRMSMVRDALFDRTNTGDNTPAFIDVELRPGTGARVDVMLKGAGSDNASAVAMLDPAAGQDGVAAFVLETVLAKATGACPPLLVGVGVGSTFDAVGRLAKHSLLREVGTRAAGPVGEFERRLLEAVNATGIGPAGLGGATTALAVHVETAACHMATLPVAVGMGCCAVRAASVELP